MNNFFKSFELFLTESFSEETAFIKAIFANPFDSTTKLVYADWLDEHDDRFGGLIRAAVASTNTENHKKKDPNEESFYKMATTSASQNFDKFGILNVDWKKGSFGYRDPEDLMQWTVFVFPTGQIMAKYQDIDKSSQGTPFHPVEVDELRPIQAKRTALLLLLEEMVESHRIKNPHGKLSHHRPHHSPSKAIPPNAPMENVWSDHAMHSVEMAMRWFIDSVQYNAYSEEEVLDMFKELINHYIVPLEKLTANLGEQKYTTDWREFQDLRNEIINMVGTERNICSDNLALCELFAEATTKIISRTSF